MSSLSKMFFSVFFTIFLALFFPGKCHAVSYTTSFSDNFNQINETNWTVFRNGGEVKVNPSNQIEVSANSGTFFPYVYNNLDIFPVSNYVMKARFMLSGIVNYGSGIILSNTLATNGTHSDLGPNDVIFQIWPESESMANIWTTMCPVSEHQCSNSTYRKIFPLTMGTFHNLTIESKDGIYSVSVDDGAPELFDENKQIKYFWFGNPQTTSTSTQRPKITIDYIDVSTPSVEKESVVVLPGFGGSWDVQAIISGQPGSNWKIPPFVKEYDGIISSLKNAGFVENTNLFIFPYDWRKSLSSLATDLNNYIVSNNLEDKKINLVGHSLGGLVARTYLQNYNNSNVQKVITAGSPHKGIIDAYGLWEGATVWDAVWWQKVLLEIATEVNRQPGETKIQSVQRIAPSIKDLLPTEDYLKQNNQSKPISTMHWKNDFLIARNSELNSFLTKITSGGSKDYPGTRKGINITNPNSEDKAQGLWVDGKPNSTNTFEFGLGDGFVSEKSSMELFTNKLALTGGHGETISSLDNIKKILGELKIATDSAVGSSSDSRKTAFVAKLNSPGKLSVCLASICDGALGLVFESEKMVIIPGYSEKKYSVTVDSGGETGKYKLLMGEINDSGVWKSVVGNLVTTSQKDIYQYDAATDQISADSKTVENLLKVNWNKKPKLSEVYGIRQNILEALDKNIKEANVSEFDSNLNKWQTLDYYVASEYSKDRFFSHDGWDLGFKKGRRSKYLQKTPNYYLATLTKYAKDKTVEYEKIPYWQIKLKLDKLIQIAMLKTFIN